MKMAKASQADLDMAIDVCGALDAISGHWPWMPAPQGWRVLDSLAVVFCAHKIKLASLH